MDISGQVNHVSVFGYILVCVLAPMGAVRSYFYADAVDDFDWESLVPFEALNTYTFPLYRLHLEPDQVQNLGETEVLWHLVANQIPHM